jgi:hypothetical protein
MHLSVGYNLKFQVLIMDEVCPLKYGTDKNLIWKFHMPIL